jgi:AraC-like DNA-binding protein
MEDAKKQFVLSLLAYVVQRDIVPDRLCHLTGINLDKLMQPGAYVFTSTQITSLWRHASALTGDPMFGLHFGESLQLPALGAVGEIIKSSHTVGKGIEIAASLTPLVTDLFTMEVKAAKQRFTITLQPTKQPVEDENFAALQIADMLMVFTVHELDGLVLEKIAPVSFTVPDVSRGIDEYKRVLRCAQFNKSDRYSLSFDNKYWDVPLLSSNHELQKMLLDRMKGTLADLQTSNDKLHQRVRQYIAANSYLGVPTLYDVAANFNMTPRSMQRKLKEEQISFQDIADSVRKSMALYYLKTGNYPVKEISHMLGYNDLSAFSRAFKRWTGKAPVHYPQAGN